MFSDAKVGDIYIGLTTGRLYDVVDKTTNSICIFKRKLSNKGIDSTNWYDVKGFESEFTKKYEDTTEKRFEKLREWLHQCIKIGNYYLVTFDQYYYGMKFKDAKKRSEE